MLERIAVVDINKFNQGQRQVCMTCRAEKGRVCLVAKLEIDIGYRPYVYNL